MKSLFKNNKGMLNQFGALAVGIVALVITLAVGFLIMANVQGQIATTQGITNVSHGPGLTTAYNATTTLVNATATIPGWVKC